MRSDFRPKVQLAHQSPAHTPDFWISYAIDCFGLGWFVRQVLSRQRGCRCPETAGGPKVTAVVDVEIRLSARWRALPQRRCSASHYAEQRRDADLDSCRRWR